jgi:hypothetical protein
MGFVWLCRYNNNFAQGKDDLTKASQLGSKLGYPGCPECKLGDGLWHQKELGFSDALRYSGKMDVVQKPQPHEMYGVFLQNHTVALSSGEDITGCACTLPLLEDSVGQEGGKRVG